VQSAATQVTLLGTAPLWLGSTIWPTQDAYLQVPFKKFFEVGQFSLIQDGQSFDVFISLLQVILLLCDFIGGGVQKALTSWQDVKSLRCANTPARGASASTAAGLRFANTLAREATARTAADRASVSIRAKEASVRSPLAPANPRETVTSTITMR